MTVSSSSTPTAGIPRSSAAASSSHSPLREMVGGPVRATGTSASTTGAGAAGASSSTVSSGGTNAKKNVADRLASDYNPTSLGFDVNNVGNIHLLKKRMASIQAGTLEEWKKRNGVAKNARVFSLCPHLPVNNSVGGSPTPRSVAKSTTNINFSCTGKVVCGEVEGGGGEGGGRRWRGGWGWRGGGGGV